jgi:protein phosphatase
MTLALRYAVRSDVGLLREGNEDSAYASPCLLAVADGMGGHAAGEVASAVAIASVATLDGTTTPQGDLLKALKEAVHSASDTLHQMASADPAVEGMGTTLTAMLFSGNCTAVANIGDSRGYLLRRGTLTRITEDHVLGKLVASPAPPRISTIIVRYLDGRADRSPDLTLRMTLPGDRYLICSDGLSGVLESRVIRDVLASVDDADQAAADLLRLTHEAGAPDNVTAIVADVPEGIWRAAEGGPVVLGAAASRAGTS